MVICLAWYFTHIHTRTQCYWHHTLHQLWRVLYRSKFGDFFIDWNRMIVYEYIDYWCVLSWQQSKTWFLFILIICERDQPLLLLLFLFWLRLFDKYCMKASFFLLILLLLSHQTHQAKHLVISTYLNGMPFIHNLFCFVFLKQTQCQKIKFSANEMCVCACLLCLLCICPILQQKEIIIVE